MMRAAPLLLALLCACRAVPDDHGLATWVARAMAPVRDMVGGIPSQATAATLRANRLVARARAAPSRVPPMTARLVERSRSLVDGEARALYRAPRDWTEATRNGLRRAVARVQRLSRPGQVLAPDGIEATVSRRGQRLRRAGTTLGLDRPILSDPTDPDRWTALAPPPRRASLLERILGRIRP